MELFLFSYLELSADVSLPPLTCFIQIGYLYKNIDPSMMNQRNNIKKLLTLDA